jgi:hypothetical protein
MKKIVEEWKTIEGYPNYKISNMGRCKKITDHNYKSVLTVQARGVTYSYYNLSGRSTESKRGVGKLVARHFVPNPNEYKLIRFKDGNPGNFNYLNIEWVKQAATGNTGGLKKIKLRSAQIDEYRRIRGEIDRAIEYLENDKVGEYVSEVVLPIIKKCANSGRSNPLYSIIQSEMDEFISYTTEEVYDMLSRGLTLVGWGKRTVYLARQYVNKRNRQIRTTEIIEKIV